MNKDFFLTMMVGIGIALLVTTTIVGFLFLIGALPAQAAPAYGDWIVDGQPIGAIALADSSAVVVSLNNGVRITQYSGEARLIGAFDAGPVDSVAVLACGRTGWLILQSGSSGRVVSFELPTPAAECGKQQTFMPVVVK